MKLRVAKKLVRYDYAYDPRRKRLKGPTLRRAHRLIARRRFKFLCGLRPGAGRYRLTPGWRWGRWDPHLPKDPNEIPF